MRNLIAVVSTALALCLGGHASAQQPSGTSIVATKNGAGVAANHVRGFGTITAIDAKTRSITIKGDGGHEFSVEAGPDVQNFDALKVGTRVEAEYLEALTLELKKGKDVVVARSDTGEVKRAEAGATPGAMRSHEVKVTAEVVALDPATRKVSLKGPHRTIDLEIPDPEQFARIAKGDHIEATYTEATAIAVVPAERATE